LIRRKTEIGLSLAMHIGILTTVGCFIAFIELSITVGNISGVHTIASTGQLIPFVIGIASFASALRELGMIYARKVCAIRSTTRC
jgi:hypothetical protein